MERQRDYILVGSTPRDRRRRIVIEVAERHGLTPDALMQRNRTQKVAHARFEAMAMMRREFGDTFPKIGRFFGGMDHTAVMHGIRRHEEMAAR